jgi:hypothetical protein
MLPPCGLYQTTLALDDHVPAGRLVYFHNHGDPGAGIYLPSGWSANRAQWHENGHTIPDPEWARTLSPLPEEGLYRVSEPFTCCSLNCRTFETDLLVQLGYDGDAHPILFLPEWTHMGLAIPDEGFPLDGGRMGKLARLIVVESDDPDEPPATAH